MQVILLLMVNLDVAEYIKRCFVMHLFIHFWGGNDSELENPFFTSYFTKTAVEKSQKVTFIYILKKSNVVFLKILNENGASIR